MQVSAPMCPLQRDFIRAHQLGGMVLQRHPLGWQASQRRPGSLSSQPNLSAQRLPRTGLVLPPRSGLVLCREPSLLDSQEAPLPMAAGKPVERFSVCIAGGAGLRVQASRNPFRLFTA